MILASESSAGRGGDLTSIRSAISPVPTNSIYAFGNNPNINPGCSYVSSCVSVLAFPRLCYQQLEQDSKTADSEKFCECMCANSKAISIVYYCASCYTQSLMSESMDINKFQDYYCNKVFSAG